MRGLVLASGRGSRLGTPRGAVKPLVPVAGLAVLERAVRNLVDVGVERVVVSVGYRGDEVAAACADLAQRLGVPIDCVRNERYDEGNGLSVLAAEEALGDEPFLLVMSDHVLDSSILRALADTAVPAGGAVLAVDRSVDRTDVDLDDVTRVRTRGRRILDIGKGLADYDAFDTGAFLCSPAVFDALRRAAAGGDTSLSAGMRLLAAEGRLIGCDVSGALWVDVDTRRELRLAGRRLLSHGGKERDGAVARVNRLLSGRVITPALLAIAPRISADAITLLAAAVAIGAAGAVLAGWVIVAALLLQLASVIDGADGEVARVARRGSPFGAFFDPMLDRVVDGVVLSAAALYASHQADGSLAIGMTGALATVGHLLVSYSTSRAALDLGHRYDGPLLASGRGRDLRLLVLCVGLAGSAWIDGLLPASLGVLAALTWAIVVTRIAWSWRANRLEWADVDTVVVDFDGTIADSMTGLAERAVRIIHEELGLDPAEARARYLASTGWDFASQLRTIAPDRRAERVRAERRFEEAKATMMHDVAPFPDVVEFLDTLTAAGVDVHLCSSTRQEVVTAWIDRHGLASRFASVQGWAPGRGKAEQLEAVVGRAADPGRCVMIGDSRRDGELAAALGIGFRGVHRQETSNLAFSGFRYGPDLRSIAAAIARRRRLGVVVETGGRRPAPAPHALRPVAVPTMPAHPATVTTRRPIARRPADAPARSRHATRSLGPTDA